MYLPSPTILPGFPGEPGHTYHRVVIEDALCVLASMFRGSDPPTGNGTLQIGWRNHDAPMAVRVAGGYEIWLSSPAHDHAQIVFQLSHEYCHIMIHADRADGIVEGLCTAASFNALELITALWRPNRAAGQSAWAGNFTVPYITDNVRAILAEQPNAVYAGQPGAPQPLPGNIQASALVPDYGIARTYWRAHRTELDVDPCFRPLNGLAAVLLREGPIDWPAMVGLGNKMIAIPPRPRRTGPYAWELPHADFPLPLQ